MPLLLLLFGVIDSAHPLWLWQAPIVGGVFLGLTGVLLIWDLEHPWRFYMIFTRAHWRSWLVKGAFIIAGYSTVLALHFGAALAGAPELTVPLAFAGLPLAALTAIYTAYLFAQAKARDLWQSPLLPPHLLVQSLLAGSAALVPAATLAHDTAVGTALAWLLAGTALTHLLCVLGETTLTHVTAHARLASWEMTSGRYRAWFRIGSVLVAVALVAPWLGLGSTLPLAAMAALAGLFCFEHAYVQAGQAVPLA